MPVPVLDQHLQTFLAECEEVASLEEVVGWRLVATESGEFTDEHVATDAPGWSRVWLQLPRGTATFQPRLSLTPDPTVCATREQATARFGFAARVPVHPGQRSPPEEWWQYEPRESLPRGGGRDPRTSAGR